MKKTSIYLSLAAASLMMASCGNAPEKEAPATAEAPATVAEAPAAPAPVDSATAMQNWMAYATPGDMHKMMAEEEGNWTAEITSWMAEGAPAQTSKGEAQYKMIMGGRYQQCMFKGDMGGMPFEGMSLSGYDNSKKVFMSTWVDNMGTGMMAMEGTYDAATKKLEMKGKGVDPSNNTECAMREVVTHTDAKHMTMEMYSTPQGGKEFKNMEIKYTKK
ncbi:hypothetical protein GCM10023093_26930 [Nemorincola caseinilytica]|uniref:DUF1579 domain-containing protein n=1 Tax=Nemorincola caseinilytica TaxID=2054315 RepID=A0ABP8NPK5_9BACT